MFIKSNLCILYLCTTLSIFVSFFLGLPTQEIHAKEIKPISVTASSVYKSSANRSYHPEQLLDNNFQTPWVADAGLGIGEWLEFSFSEEHILTTIDIRNGYQRTETSYKNNSRVATLSVIVDGKQIAILKLKDLKDWQKFTLPNIKANKISFHIESIHKSNKDLEVALSDIRFYSTTNPPVIDKENNIPVSNTSIVEKENNTSASRKDNVKNNNAASINTSKEHREFLAKLNIFVNPEAAIKSLENTITTPILFSIIPSLSKYTIYDASITQEVLALCQAMQAEELTYRGKPILTAFANSFPHDAHVEIYSALFSVYAKNPYFEIPYITLKKYDAHYKRAIQQYKMFSEYCENFKSYFPLESDIETLYFVNMLDCLILEATKYGGFVGNEELLNSLVLLKNTLMNDLQAKQTTNKETGTTLYKEWTSGMTIPDIYAKICQDGIKYDVYIPDSVSNLDPVSLVEAGSYNETKRRTNFFHRFDLAESYYYPGKGTRDMEELRILLDKLEKTQFVSVGGIQTIFLEDNVSLVIGNGVGLIAVLKKVKGREADIVNALTQKYGNSLQDEVATLRDISSSIATGKVKNRSYIKYVGSQNDLHIFMEFGTIHYADKKILDRIYSFLAKNWEVETKQKENALQDEI